MTERAVPRGRWLLFWSIALGGAAFDLASKWWIFRRVGPPGSPPVPLVADILELRTTYNTGALWGIGAVLPYSSLMFASLSIVAAVAICYWLFVRGGARDRGLTIALSLIMAGALGNCYDRLRYGHVRDFMHFHVDSVGFDFAIYNFADNMLVAGAVVLVLLALKPEPVAMAEPEPSTSGHPEAPGSGVSGSASTTTS